MNQEDLEPGQDWPGFFMGAESASERSEHSLVKGAKSPTALISPESVPKTPAGTPGAYTVIQYREWAEEYRIFTRVENTSGSLPPDNSGPRLSRELSWRGLRKIAESCQYVATCHGGYQTFLTLTFTPEARQRLEDGETTVQREVSRFADGLQKIFARGWMAVNEKTSSRERQVGQEGPLLYLWVVEVPDNERGEPNPHVHMLLNWRVPKTIFRSWAARMESLWGQGFAHLEKIKDAGAAGSYMMKAAGYLCKSRGQSDQGEVRGNRYGMSAEARAPGWVTIEESQLHIMGALIADLHQHITEKYGELYKERARLKACLDRIPKTKKPLRRKVGNQLEKVRNSLIRDVPVVAGKYQVLIRGKAAYYEFMQWARSPGHWRAQIPWLPEKGRGEDWRPGERPDTLWYARFKKRHYWRRACRAMAQMAWSDWEWGQARTDYEEWSSIPT